MNIIEMQMNKTGVMLGKTKLFIVRIDGVYFVLPIEITKIEIRLRNVLINSRTMMEVIAEFAMFYYKMLQENN